MVVTLRERREMVMKLLWRVLFCGVLALRVVECSFEVEALMEIKAGLDPSGKILHSWVADGDPCKGTFEGVFCNEHGKVGNISLQGKGLSGYLSPAISHLKCLNGLFLHYNNLIGTIPKELGNLTELVDLYLDVNNLSGTIPPRLSQMSSLQALQLCYNNLSGPLPSELGSLKKLSILALQHNQLSGAIPSSLGSLKLLTRLDLSCNLLTGAIPRTLANPPNLTTLNISSNRLSGRIPEELGVLHEGFQYHNNSKLCGERVFSLPACNASVPDAEHKPLSVPGLNISPNQNASKPKLPVSANISDTCQSCTTQHSPHVSKIGIVSAIIALVFAVTFAVGSLVFAWYRKQKQKVASSFDAASTRASSDQSQHNREDHSKKPHSPLVLIEYSSDWDSLEDRSAEFGCLRMNFGEIEYATNNFSENNFLGKNKFANVYKGVLKDGSSVVIKSISKTSCKTDEVDFQDGLRKLTQIHHENLVNLKGFCCSKARSECFLVYEFVSNGTLLQKLEDNSKHGLDWSTRVKIMYGVAKGMEYLHHGVGEPIVHQNLWVANIMLDSEMNPKISDCALQRLLGDDIVFSILKSCAALGYLAPEYAAVGRLTFKSDVYAFGKMLLHVLTGVTFTSVSPDIRSPALRSVKNLVDTGKVDQVVDKRLAGKFFAKEASILAKLAISCIHELPSQRPSMRSVIRKIETEILNHLQDQQ